MSKTKKKAPKLHTKKYDLHVVETDDRILIAGGCSRAYMHFKRWSYQNLPERAIYWDKTAKLYVINKENTQTTIHGLSIVDTLKEIFTVKAFLPFED